MAFDWSSPQFANLFRDLPDPNAAPPPPPFIPSYESHSIRSENGVIAPIAKQYTLSAASAEFLRKRYNPNGVVINVPFGGAGGPNSTDALERVLRWPNGALMNAGFLAQMYSNNPEDQFPGLADKLCKGMIAAIGAA